VRGSRTAHSHRPSGPMACTPAGSAAGSAQETALRHRGGRGLSRRLVPSPGSPSATGRGGGHPCLGGTPRSRGGKPRPAWPPAQGEQGDGAWARFAGPPSHCCTSKSRITCRQGGARRQILKYCLPKKEVLSVGLREGRGRARSPRHLSRWAEEGACCGGGEEGAAVELAGAASGCRPRARSCTAPHHWLRSAGSGGSSRFASWHLCEGHSGWSGSRGRCQAGAWQKSENFLTVTNACLKKCVYLPVVCSISLCFGKAILTL